ncbi:MAG: SEC-C metal-binding domain-containing protein, partial [Chloroflexota bacterium]
ENLRADRFTHFIDDTIAEMQSWHSFRRNEPARAPALSDTTLYTKASGQVVREGRKIGRNEPCPCGSGKKYKRCHGKKQ